MGIPPEDRRSAVGRRRCGSCEANPGRIEAAAAAWRRLGGAATTVGDDLDADAGSSSAPSGRARPATPSPNTRTK